MKPYYEADGIIIYLGDCRDILPTLSGFSATITDPPYNCGKDYGTYKDSLPEEEYAATMGEIVSLCRHASANQGWVAPRFQMRLWLSLLPDAHVIVVRRGATGPFRRGWSDQYETVLTVGKPSRCVSDLWDGIRLKGEGYFFREETYGHPGYTPSPIVLKLIDLLAPDSVIDPFCGTGTTLVAAKQLGRRAIGIELEEKYCEIAVKRLRQRILL